MRVHHILADGREIDNLDGYIVHLDGLPQLQHILREANKDYKKNDPRTDEDNN